MAKHTPVTHCRSKFHCNGRAKLSPIRRQSWKLCSRRQRALLARGGRKGHTLASSALWRDVHRFLGAKDAKVPGFWRPPRARCIALSSIGRSRPRSQGHRHPCCTLQPRPLLGACHERTKPHILGTGAVNFSQSWNFGARILLKSWII
jgi:hypothetical protein